MEQEEKPKGLLEVGPYQSLLPHDPEEAEQNRKLDFFDLVVHTASWLGKQVIFLYKS